MDLTALVEQISGIEGVVPSVVALLNAYSEYVIKHKADPVALQNAAERIKAVADTLGQAVADHPAPVE
jgi:hypothetical protein